MDAPELSSIDFIDVRDYIQYDDELMERLRYNAVQCVRNNIGDYRDEAINIIKYFEDMHDDIKIEWPEGGDL